MCDDKTNTNELTMPPDVIIRDGREEDIPSVQRILAYYITKTVITFRCKVLPVEVLLDTFHDITDKQHLPYLVADIDGEIAGYTYASGFRSSLMGYAATVELSLFCHPDYRRQGIGKRLLDTLLQRLRRSKHVACEVHYPAETVEEEVKEVLAVMAVDGNDQGLALRDWYVRMGFTEVGRLHQVGLKHGRRYVNGCSMMYISLTAWCIALTRSICNIHCSAQEG